MPQYKIGLAKQEISAAENVISEAWTKQRIFEKSVEQRPSENQYVLYDGPPFATGLPHYGHILAGALKDVLPRYHTMRGKRVERRWGWDTHGVPVEYQVEQELKLQGHEDIGQYGIAEFNEKCRSVVLKYAQEWKKYVKRMGRFIDMENDYKTMDPHFMESVWAVFKKLYDKGLVYEGQRVLNYSTGLGTPLSDFEAKQNYQKVQDPSLTVSFALEAEPETNLLCWTTTPWSLPTNACIAINTQKNEDGSDKITYLKVSNKKGQSFILAKDAFDKYKQHIAGYEESALNNGFETKVISAESLIGKKYRALFDVMDETQACHHYMIVSSDHVSADAGTGLAHIAPAFGEDDFQIGKKYGLKALDFFNANGQFQDIPTITDKKTLPNLTGINFKDADKLIIADLKARGHVIHVTQEYHEYPHCWRTDKPLMYRIVPSWYVEVTKIKDKIVENNKKINWYPSHVGEKRFHNWLENARDWSISRNRYWGTPIPIWRNEEDPLDVMIIGSITELEELTGIKVTDLHRHHIDDLTFVKGGKKYRRISDVFDCWFESGAMPYAQQHYPFEGEQKFLEAFPADFIAEGVDQTRGWFYTLNVLSTALYDKPAFKNCVVSGILLGSDGKKMSKSKKNYPPIDEVLNKYGADAMRLVLLSSAATRAKTLAVKDQDFKNATKNIILPALNIYDFFASHAQQANFSPEPNFSFSNINDAMDQWLIFRTAMFKEKIEQSYNTYNMVKICKNIEDFINDLSSWYLHNSREKFKLQTNSLTKVMQNSFECLYYALDTLSLCCAPVIPFTSERIFQALHGEQRSVHLQNWPAILSIPAYRQTYDGIELVKNICHLGMSIRTKNLLSLRQPLNSISLDIQLCETLTPYEALIKQALNIKNINWLQHKSEVFEPKIKLNPAVLGKKYAAKFKDIKKALDLGMYELSDGVLIIANETLKGDDFSTVYQPKEKKLGALHEGIWMTMDGHITAELDLERQLNELIRTIQQLRKDAGFHREQKADIFISNAEARKLYSENKEIIVRRTNSTLVDAFMKDETVQTKRCAIGTQKGLKGHYQISLKETKREEQQKEYAGVTFSF